MRNPRLLEINTSTLGRFFLSPSYIANFCTLDFFRMCKVTLSVRESDRLDGGSILFHGSSSFRSLWRRLIFGSMLRKNILKPNDPTQLAAHCKKETGVKKLVLDSVKNHFISHILDFVNLHL